MVRVEQRIAEPGGETQEYRPSETNKQFPKEWQGAKTFYCRPTKPALYIWCEGKPMSYDRVPYSDISGAGIIVKYDFTLQSYIYSLLDTCLWSIMQKEMVMLGTSYMHFTAELNHHMSWST